MIKKTEAQLNLTEPLSIIIYTILTNFMDRKIGYRLTWRSWRSW